MAEYIRLKPMSHSNKIVATQPTHERIQICSIVVSNSSWHDSLKKQTRNNTWILRETKCLFGGAMRGKNIKAKNTTSLSGKAYPFFLIRAFFDCVTILGLSFQGCVIVIVVSAVFWKLSRNLKTWKSMEYQSKGKEGSLGKMSGRKWTWMEDLVLSMDVSPTDDFFINLCVLLGLGIVCGFLVVVRRFDYKNVTK